MSKNNIKYNSKGFIYCCVNNITYNDLKKIFNKNSEKEILKNIKLKWQISNVCKKCKTKLDNDNIKVLHGYWFPGLSAFCHSCFDECKNNEINFCKQIDKSCNDCKNFEPNNNQPYTNCRVGKCNIKNKEVYGFSNTCCPDNDKCFEMRL